MTPQQIADAATWAAVHELEPVGRQYMKGAERFADNDEPDTTSQRRDFRSIRLDAKTQAACDAALSLQMAQQDAYEMVGGA